MAKYSTNWSGVPGTCETASIQKTEMVKNSRVIHLAKAGIRGAEVSGTFKLAEGAEVKTLWGQRRVLVECLWFGCKPKTTWMHLSILSTPKIEPNYSGEVVADIGLKRR